LENISHRKPFKKTYANTLMNVEKDIYFVDLENAFNNEPTKFFSKNQNI
jgi:erythromycin esterase